MLQELHWYLFQKEWKQTKKRPGKAHLNILFYLVWIHLLCHVKTINWFKSQYSLALTTFDFELPILKKTSNKKWRIMGKVNVSKLEGREFKSVFTA